MNNSSEKNNESSDASVPEHRPATVDLQAPGVKRALGLRIAADVDKYCEVTYNDGHRTRLGASEIGEECSRKLWYKFRWISAEQFNGRMQRLFQRGHREEPFVFEHLRGIGCEVWEWKNAPIYTHTGEIEFKGEQYNFSAICGHFGGSIDAVAKLPKHYNVPEPMLVSVKTNMTGKTFTDLSAEGMKLVKPMHYAQESVYGRAFGMTHAIYVNRNKNDDDQHIEIVELDHKLAEQLEIKAQRIIYSPEPPSRLSESPAFVACKNCWFGNDKSGICFNKPGRRPADVNCRSCKHSRPSDTVDFLLPGAWVCEKYPERGPIPIEVIKQGCQDYEAIV